MFCIHVFFQVFEIFYVVCICNENRLAWDVLCDCQSKQQNVRLCMYVVKLQLNAFISLRKEGFLCILSADL
jgi:hypothetical protein